VDVNTAIARTNQTKVARLAALDKKGLTVLATLVNALDGLKQKPKNKL
jgi:hypothetical protein